MAADRTTLKCESCGAKVRVRGWTNRFACSYCGTEILLSPKPKKTEATIPAAPPVATDPAADAALKKKVSVFSLTRARQRLFAARRELREMQDPGSGRGDPPIVVGATLVSALLALILVASDQAAIGVVFAFFALIAGSVFAVRIRNAKIKELQSQARQLDRQVREEERLLK